MHCTLAGKACESSSLHLAYNEIIPPGWDAPAFCTNLFHARRFVGLRHGSSCKVPLARTTYEWKAKAKKASLQKAIHACINNHIMQKSCWVPFINERLIVLGASLGASYSLTMCGVISAV